MRGDTYHQLDLLGRAAVGVGRGCRVGRFALAARVHGRATRGARSVNMSLKQRMQLRRARPKRDRGVGGRGYDVAFTTEARLEGAW